MEDTCDDASRINVNNEIHDIIIHIMVRTGIIDMDQHEKMVMCSINISGSLYMQDPWYIRQHIISLCIVLKENHHSLTQNLCM